MEQRNIPRTITGGIVEWTLRLISENAPGMLDEIDAALPNTGEDQIPSSQKLVVAIIQSALDSVGCRLPDKSEKDVPPMTYWQLVLGGATILYRVAALKDVLNETGPFASKIRDATPGNVLAKMQVLTRRGFAGASGVASPLQLWHVKKALDMLNFTQEQYGGKLFRLVGDATAFMSGGVGAADKSFSDAVQWLDHGRQGSDAIAGVIADIGFMQRYADVTVAVRGTAITSTCLAFAWAVYGMETYLRRQG